MVWFSIYQVGERGSGGWASLKWRVRRLKIFARNINTSQMFQNTAQCVNQWRYICRFLWVVRKWYTILNLQKTLYELIKSPLSKTYRNYEFSLTLVNLQIMSLERLSVHRKGVCNSHLKLYTNPDPQKHQWLPCIRTAPSKSSMSTGMSACRLGHFFRHSQNPSVRKTRTTPSVSLIPHNWFSSRPLHAKLCYLQNVTPDDDSTRAAHAHSAVRECCGSDWGGNGSMQFHPESAENKMFLGSRVFISGGSDRWGAGGQYSI